ncbi:MAG: dipeptidase [Bryobacterales bacterium]|nr:dipeptidase [Bryobacterales bacterium]
MNRFLAALALLLCSSRPALPQTKKYTDAEVEKIHRSLLLIDTHNDITSKTVQGFDIASHGAATHTDLARLREGNVGAVFFAVYVAASYVNGNRSAHRTLEMIDTVKHDIVAKHPGAFELATTAAGIEAAHRRGKIAALMGLEGGHGIEDSLRLLRDYYDLGIRYMTLTHANTNNWADSSGDKPQHDGLTDFGKQVVQEMNRLGMMVDISHVADKTFWDALAASKAPVFASHSSCRALSSLPRNMSDDMIRALAKKGGVIQINFGCDFLSQKAADESPLLHPLATGAAKKSREERKKTPVRASLGDIVAHIDHVVKIAGIDYVGIGSDFDGISCTPAGLDDVSKFPNLTRALLEKGYTPQDIGKIYGGNLLRVMRGVERIAAESRQ